MLPLPDVAAVNEVELLSDGTVLYSVETYLRPPYFSRFDEEDGQDVETTEACADQSRVLRRIPR